MKRLKTISVRVIFYIIAFQILNQSIDLDHLGIYALPNMADYDDIDSIAEFIIEKIVGDDHFTSEQDDDSGNSQDSCVITNIQEPLFIELIFSIPLQAGNENPVERPVCINNAKKTCKGYFSIISPPPNII